MTVFRGLKAVLFSCAALGALAMPAHAEDTQYDWGKFPGYTLKVKLIGGTQYEKLYTRIAEWEKATGAKVEIVSSKNHFELDREIKQDIASGSITWCVGSNHTSFAPQYGDLYIDLKEVIPETTLAEFVPGTLASSMVDGRLVQLPRVTDVSNLYYQKELYENADNKAKYKAKFGTDLAPPKTFDEFKQQIIFFANPPNLYGTAFAGKDEGMTGRFMEIVRANGGDMFDANWNPTFNSQAGLDALQWFIDIYNAKAVPAGTVNYTWDDIGQAMAAGTLAVDLDWPGWAAFFNDPKSSKIAGKIGLAVAPVGTAGKRGGWSGSHSFSVTKDCDNKPAAVSFVTFLTDYQSEMMEARAGNLPTRTKAFADVVDEFKKDNNTYMADMFATWEQSLADARTPPLVPQWIEVSNVIWPELQAAIVGQKTPKDALDTAAEKAKQIMEDAGVLK
ncbi:sugar ABC transporter substrate-binding protein [Kaistia algarum]|uniref:extracellular solute-binding protein n=1 Tax=Kaistia algarum TaxID=2083279 RepID=UPI000CE7FD4A|nr:extracellular solute-binding protein [Kaistia algarum]MCX5513210.1 sugar ABC transporter substrate-binding protein [Kaistia algarum]PPE81326.1 sugar ABC transporter substrate-binding protein [Kaistia algarum]